MKQRAVLLLLLLDLVIFGLFAKPAAAAAWSNGCGYSGMDTAGTVGTPQPSGLIFTASSTLATPGPPPGLSSVGDSTQLCLQFNAADSTFVAGPFVVLAPSAQIVFDPDLGAVVSVAGTPAVTPAICSGPVQALANPEFSCLTMGGANGNASLSGVEGADSIQNATKWVGPGTYVLRITGACAASKTCRVWIRGSR